MVDNTDAARHERWFEKMRGRPPADPSEIESLWLEEYFKLNPIDQARRQLMVEYAESEGGIALEYLKRLFPEYWLLPTVEGPDAVAPALGLGEQDENRILGEALSYMDSRITTLEAWAHRDDPKVPPDTRA